MCAQQNSSNIFISYRVSSSQDQHKQPEDLTVDTSDQGADNPFKEGYTPKSQSEQQSPVAPLSPKLQYREVQKGGEIPLSGLRKPAPPTPTKKGMLRVRLRIQTIFSGCTCNKPG